MTDETGSLVPEMLRGMGADMGHLKRDIAAIDVASIDTRIAVREGARV